MSLASSVLLSAFAAALADSYPAKTISNYINGMHAWYITYGIPWEIDQNKMPVLLKAANAIASPTVK
jgi:hypothetical protein